MKHYCTLGCSKIEGLGGQTIIFSGDFDWTVLSDQRELCNEPGIQEHQLDEISRFMTISGAIQNDFLRFSRRESNKVWIRIPTKYKSIVLGY